MTATSQHIYLPICHGTNVRPSGRFPSVRNNPDGSFVTGTPAEAKEQAIRSWGHDAWLTCRGSFTYETVSQWHWCGSQKSKPSLKPTAILAASSSSLKPHEAMGMTNSQSPLCCVEAARNEAGRCVEVRLASTCALSSSTPGRSKKGCLDGKMPETRNITKFCWPSRQISLERFAIWFDGVSQNVMSSWTDSVLAAEAIKAEIASEVTVLFQCNHFWLAN